LSQILTQRGAARPFLYVFDTHGLTGGVAHLRVGGVERELLRFRNALALRDALEELKEPPPSAELPLALVAFEREADASGAVADLAARAEVVALTPHQVLTFVRPECEWPEDVNMLRGADFWTVAPALLAVRDTWGETLPASSVPLLIAEAWLGRPLRDKLTRHDAVALWDHVETDDDARTFLDRNPRVRRAVQRQIQRAMTAEEKLERDPDFAVLLWLYHLVRKHAEGPDLLLPQLLPASVWDKYGDEASDELLAMAERVLETDPLAAISQMRMAERALCAEGRRERLLLNLLGVEGAAAPQNAARIASAETISGWLAIHCLRALTPAVAGDGPPIPRRKLRAVLRAVGERHVAARYPHYYPRLAEATRLFRSLVALGEHVAAFRAREWEHDWPILDVEAWVEELHPSSLVPIALLSEEVSALSQQMPELLGGPPQGVLAQCQEILSRANREFARLVQANYVRWIAQHHPPPLLTVDFLDEVFLPHWRRVQGALGGAAAVVYLCHGLRLDEWHVVEPLFTARLRRHRPISNPRLLALLPSNWSYNTGAIVLGRFPSLSDTGTVGGLFGERLAAEGIRFLRAVTDPPDGVPSLSNGVVLVNVNLPHIGRSKTRPTGEAREDIVRDAGPLLDVLLAGVPADALVIALSNGGSTAVAGPAVAARSGVAEHQHRWLGLSTVSAFPSLPSETAYFHAEAIHLPNPSVVRCAFAPPGTWFDTEARDCGRRYLSGGISPEEMILPCTVYVPKRLATARKQKADA
jgi:hypothetical protein